MSVRSGNFSLALLLISSYAVSNAIADTVSTGLGGDWSDPNNWSPAVIPGNASDVFVNGGITVTVDTFGDGHSLTLGGSLFTLPPDFYNHSTGLSFIANATVNSSGNIGAAGAPVSFLAPFAVGGNLTNAGNVQLANALSVAGSLNNSGFLGIQGAFGPPQPFVGTVAGDVSNSGTLQIGFPAGVSIIEGQNAPTTLNIAGALVNAANGTVTVNNPTNTSTGLPDPSSPSSLNVRNLTNHGAVNFGVLTTSTAQTLDNFGNLFVLGDAAGHVGKLTAGTLKIESGGTVGVDGIQGGTLVVGSGAVPAGFTGYYQSANGILDQAGGSLSIAGAASLNGTLDIMLGTGSKPIGTVFTVLSAGTGSESALTGAFSDVEGLVFDGGHERYAVDYDYPANMVTLTVEANTTPEPGSLFLLLLGAAGMLTVFAFGKIPVRRSPDRI
jgi:hypothetical protein